jgi:hypothetical protein
VQDVPSLAPGASAVVWMRGPACQRWVDAHVDPESVVVEGVEVDNHALAACADIPHP